MLPDQNRVINWSNFSIAVSQGRGRAWETVRHRLKKKKKKLKKNVMSGNGAHHKERL